MAKAFLEVFRDAKALSDEERAQLAGLLIDSLDSNSEPDVEAAWATEIERRSRDLEAGLVQTVPWETVRQRLLDRVNAG